MKWFNVLMAFAWFVVAGFFAAYPNIDVSPDLNFWGALLMANIWVQGV